METSLKVGSGAGRGQFHQGPDSPGAGALDSTQEWDWLREGSELACTVQEARLASECVLPESLGQQILPMPGV